MIIWYFDVIIIRHHGFLPPPPPPKSTIQAVGTTANVDNPENGLEALAQVVSCEEIIGWRSRSATGPERGLTRVVLFLTDDQFHYSGEGRVSFLVIAIGIGL